MPIYALGDLEPSISAEAYIHPDAVVIGQVFIAEGTTIWPCAVLRGDYQEIHVGPRTSIQDGTVIHTTTILKTIVGADCIVGHNAYLEGCVVEDRCLIGSSALVLNEATVEHGAVIAAGAVVREKSVVHSKTMVAGVPAVERGVVSEEIAGRMERIVARYVENGRRFASELRRID